ncbi:MAG: hypothetical protein ACREQV_27175, partial [Candidatus Binatia bacterium]
DQMKRLRENERFIAYSKVTKHPFCIMAPSDWIYTNKVVLIDFDRPDLLAICLSSFFHSWVEQYSGAGRGATLQLSIRESLDTFPLPTSQVSEPANKLASCFAGDVVELSDRFSVGLTEIVRGRPQINYRTCYRRFLDGSGTMSGCRMHRLSKDWN